MSEGLIQRRHPRYAVQVEASLTTPGGEQVSAVTKDISQGGICLASARRIAPGSTLRLSLALVLGTNTFSERLSLGARVVWCTALRQGHQLGVVFVDLDHEQEALLEMFLRFVQQEVLVDDEPRSEPVVASDAFDIGDADEP